MQPMSADDLAAAACDLREGTVHNASAGLTVSGLEDGCGSSRVKVRLIDKDDHTMATITSRLRAEPDGQMRLLLPGWAPLDRTARVQVTALRV